MTAKRTRIITSYEARCAAYWLYKDHGYPKAQAGLAVNRGNGSPMRAYNWFHQVVDADPSMLKANRKSSKAWKDKHREENRARDREYRRFKETPFYKALKSTGR